MIANTLIGTSLELIFYAKRPSSVSKDYSGKTPYINTKLTLSEKESHARASKTFSSLRFTWITFQARGGISPSESDGGALKIITAVNLQRCSPVVPFVKQWLVNIASTVQRGASG